MAWICLDACIKQLRAEIEALTCSSISVHAFTNHHVSVKNRLIFFHVVVTSVATFAAGHRTIFQQELAAHDVAHRKLLRSVIAWGYGPVTFLARNPARLERVSFNFCGPSWLETLFTHMLEQHGTLAHHAVNLPRDRWLYAGYGIGNLSAGADGRPTLDITYRWRAAPKASFCQQTDSLWQATASRSSASLPWPGQCCPWNKPDERLVQAGRCFSQNDTYDREAATFCWKKYGARVDMIFYIIGIYWNGKTVALPQQHGFKTSSEQFFKWHWWVCKVLLHYLMFWSHIACAP